MKFRQVVEDSSKLSPEELAARHELWRQGDLSWKLKGKQRVIYDTFINQEDDVSCVLASRRLGKCLAKGTLVPTVHKGFVNIEDLQIGDLVYGYNSDGSVTPTRVLDVISQGEKEVYDLINYGRPVATATLDHKFLTKYARKGREKNQELAVKDFSDQYSKIVREFVKLDNNGKNIKSAYALGALIGDGCSMQGSRNRIDLSSSDIEIVNNVARAINSKKITRNSLTNYTWQIFLNNNEYPEFYEEWCKDRYAHQKILDWREVKTWNRESKLKLIAGLIDTDGSISVLGNILTIQFGMQARSVVEVYQKLVKELWFYDVSISEDKRDKYVNGRMWCTSIRNNLISKRIVKELDDYLVCPRKKWKPEYENLLENNTREDCVGVKVTNPHRAECWDIEVDNETHLYLIENGLVTHNSTSTLVGCIEVLIQNPFAIIKYACPTQKMVRNMLYPALRVIFFDAPPEFDLNSMWNASNGELRFPNGSVLTIAGTDGNNADNLRGAYAHIVVADEAGFMDDLDYVVKNILLPQLDTTGGKLILLSTPNYYNPQHEFHKEYVIPSEAVGKLVKLTIYDSPMVNDKERERIIARFRKGKEDPKFKCEYMVEIPTTTEDTIIPEFYPVKKDAVIKEYELPNYCDFYVSGDIGVKDLSVFLFAYYDFLEATLYIMDEWVMNGLELTSSAIAAAIKLKEEELFISPITERYQEPTKRVMDNDLKLINDLRKDYGLPFTATKKDGIRAQVNKVRDLVAQGRIKIHERCKHLIYHIEHGQWIKGTNEFDHLDDSIDGEIKGGHVDSLASLTYLVRNVNMNHNPNPYPNLNRSENRHISNRAMENHSYNNKSKERLMNALIGKKGKR